MKSRQLYIDRFPASVSEVDLTEDIIDFYVKGSYVGWLPKEKILQAPLVKLGRAVYYSVDGLRIERPSQDYVPLCNHDDYGWLWHDEEAGWECLHCQIYIDDADMRKVVEEDYERWTRRKVSQGEKGSERQKS